MKGKGHHLCLYRESCFQDMSHEANRVFQIDKDTSERERHGQAELQKVQPICMIINDEQRASED